MVAHYGMAPSDFWGSTVTELFWYIAAKLDEAIRMKQAPSAGKFKLTPSEYDAVAAMIAEAKAQDANPITSYPPIGMPADE